MEAPAKGTIEQTKQITTQKELKIMLKTMRTDSAVLEGTNKPTRAGISESKTLIAPAIQQLRITRTKASIPE